MYFVVNSNCEFSGARKYLTAMVPNARSTTSAVNGLAESDSACAEAAWAVYGRM